MNQMELFGGAGMETVRRYFLGWDGPLVRRAVTFLAGRGGAPSGEKNDSMGGWVALPTLRGVRQFELAMDELVDGGGEALNVGWVGTLGALPEQLYHLSEVCPGRRQLSETEQPLLWGRVLRETPPEVLGKLVARVPAEEATEQWMTLAATINRVYVDLAAAAVSLDDVAAAIDEVERPRWGAMTELVDRYRGAMSEAGVVDVYTARALAIDGGKLREDREVVLVGCTDLSATVTEMVSRLPRSVSALIAAPEGAADHFDAVGSVDRTVWAGATVPVAAECWVTAGDVADQAEVATAIVDAMHREDGVPTESIVVGTTDESQVASLEFAMDGRGVETFRNVGYAVGQTAVGRLLRLVRDHARSRSWSSLAALVRHPDAMRCLQWGESLSMLDQLMADHYPTSVDSALSPRAVERFPAVSDLPERVDRWLAEVHDRRASRSDRAGTLSDRAGRLGRWLAKIYPIESDCDVRLHPRTSSAAASLAVWCDEHAGIDASVDPEVSTGAFWDLVVSATERRRIGDDPGDGQTPIVGWLDLALDDSPAMVVVGLNHPHVPEAVTADPFLPGTLRSKLRIADNERRYARDAHYLRCITSSRPLVRIIVGRTGADGHPTPPSRLIAAADDDTVAARVRQLIGSPSVAVRPPDHRWDATTEEAIGPPDWTTLDRPTPRRMSVTSFASYLSCPYRFYLRHVQHLRPLDDSAGELAANQFGDLVHLSLEDFGLSAMKHARDPREIERAMHDALDHRAATMFGECTTAAVHLQVLAARKKLSRVARVQADRIAQGWEIHQVEAQVDDDVASIEVDGNRMGLVGRFDRIDHHVESGRYAILDYKTHGHPPAKKHLERDRTGVERWVDLQLPLYRRMVPFLLPGLDPSVVEVGYFNIGDHDKDTAINVAEFSAAQWAEADRVIDEVVRGVMARRFEPTHPPPRYDDYGMILRTEVVR